MRLVVPLLALLLLSTATALPPILGVEPCRDVASETCVPFTRIANGIDSSAWGHYTIQTEEEWISFWRDEHQYWGAPPPVDFRTHWVAAVVMNYGTCCHPTSIREVHYAEGAYVVTYWSQPFGVLQAFSEPFDIVKVERVQPPFLPVVAAFVGPMSTPSNLPGPL